MSRPAAVYFIVAQPSYRIKIGWAVDPSQRLKALQTGSSDKLSIIGTLYRRTKQAARDLESRLHKQFKDIRIDSTEWFYPHPSLFNYMNRLGIIEDDAVSRFCESIKPPDEIRNVAERDKLTSQNLSNLILNELNHSNYLEEKKQSEEYYAYRSAEFTTAEATNNYRMGVSNWDTRHVLFLLWEAGHLINCGYDSNPAALWVLKQAVAELQKEIAKRR